MAVLNSGHTDAIQCRRPGCKTEWYHLACVILEIAPRNWICEPCTSSGTARGGKW
ncbi:hypothetical protein L208DRAFT_1291738 [Tricholoma matsutake]|nr:hypothetical protein L208DRAFT_1291738 [Tricholoma matsutake 945]